MKIVVPVGRRFEVGYPSCDKMPSSSAGGWDATAHGAARTPRRAVEREHAEQGATVPSKRSTKNAPTTTRNAPTPDASLLIPRDREILRDIIQTHTLSGEPVSSRAVSKHVEHRLSAASIRNIMADLEDLGYLLQPHISAGRVPTAAAYRLYVESLMQTCRLSSEDRLYIDEHLHDALGDGETLMSATSRLLSELSQQVGIVLTPKVEETVLRNLQLVALEGERILCVVVSTGGFVDHVVVEAGERIPTGDLVRMSNYLNENFAGLRLGEIRDRLLSLMSEERSRVDRWFTNMIALGRQAVVGSAPNVFLEGTTTLLNQPELADVDCVRRMLDTFADKARLVGLLNSCLESEGVRLCIGEDSEVTSALDFSLVATTYGIGDKSLGTLGILGPSRMEYPRIVALVRYLGANLSQALAAAS